MTSMKPNFERPTRESLNQSLTTLGVVAAAWCAVLLIEAIRAALNIHGDYRGEGLNVTITYVLSSGADITLLYIAGVTPILLLLLLEQPPVQRYLYALIGTLLLVWPLAIIQQITSSYVEGVVFSWTTVPTATELIAELPVTIVEWSLMTTYYGGLVIALPVFAVLLIAGRIGVSTPAAA